MSNEITDHMSDWDLANWKSRNSQPPGDAKHFSIGKPELHQIPRWVLWQVAKVCMYGALKYGKWNWRLGMQWSQVLDSNQRHIDDWWEGQNLDHESKLHHLDHAICDLIILRWYTRHYQKGDDRPLITGDNKENLYAMDGTISPELQQHWEEILCLQKKKQQKQQT